MIVPQPPEEYPPPAKTPEVKYGGVKVNWPAILVIVVVLVVVALLSWVAALTLGLLIVLLLVVNNSGTGRWITGGIGDDTNAAIPERRKRPRDY